MSMRGDPFLKKGFISVIFFVGKTFGKVFPNVLARFTPFQNFPHIFLAKLVRLTRFIYALAPASTLGRLLAKKPSTTKCSK